MLLLMPENNNTTENQTQRQKALDFILDYSDTYLKILRDRFKSLDSKAQSLITSTSVLLAINGYIGKNVFSVSTNKISLLEVHEVEILSAILIILIVSIFYSIKCLSLKTYKFLASPEDLIGKCNKLIKNSDNPYDELINELPGHYSECFKSLDDKCNEKVKDVDRAYFCFKIGLVLTGLFILIELLKLVVA